MRLGPLCDHTNIRTLEASRGVVLETCTKVNLLTGRGTIWILEGDQLEGRGRSKGGSEGAKDNGICVKVSQ